MTDLDALRVEVAAAHGLDEGAAPFLVGSTLVEIEQSAQELVGLIGSANDPHPASAPFAGLVDPRLKAERKRALARLLIGPPAQPRDEHGRFAARGFDGGARTPAAIRESPERQHDQLVGQLAGLSRTFRGSGGL